MGEGDQGLETRGGTAATKAGRAPPAAKTRAGVRSSLGKAIVARFDMMERVLRAAAPAGMKGKAGMDQIAEVKLT